MNRALSSMLACASALFAIAACDIPPPVQQVDGRLNISRRHPHKKPGASLNESMMCSCMRCEVAMCCKELEQEQEQTTKKCTSFDFENCGGLTVSSCEGRCYQHRWRVEEAKGCETDRPAACCYAETL